MQHCFLYIPFSFVRTVLSVCLSVCMSVFYICILDALLRFISISACFLAPCTLSDSRRLDHSIGVVVQLLPMEVTYKKYLIFTLSDLHFLQGTEIGINLNQSTCNTNKCKGKGKGFPLQV